MAEALLISGGNVIDGTGAPPVANTSVLVEDGRITAMGAEAEERSAAAGATTIDATSKTVMPGLHDSHLHSTFDMVQSNDELFFHREPILAALVTAQNLKKVLRAGVTSFFDPDSVGGMGPRLREAIEAGVIEGPRMVAGCHALMTAIGGTAALSAPAGALIPDEGKLGYIQIVNSVEEVVLWTRRHIKYGADWIKIHATGSLHDKVGEVTAWTFEELRASCDAAHELGVPVSAHCSNAQSIVDCAKAGVDLIWHASFLDEAGIEACLENGSAISPTFTFLANLADFGPKVGATPGMQDVFRGEIEATATMLRKAYDQGVLLISGTESGFCLTPYGEWHSREMEIFVEEMGLTPLEAITTATKNGAFCMKLEGELGTVEVGMLADLLVIDGDPSRDIKILGDKSRILEVISRGQRIDLDIPWPSHGNIPGWKVGNWAYDWLTWERAHE